MKTEVKIVTKLLKIKNSNLDHFVFISFFFLVHISDWNWSKLKFKK